MVADGSASPAAIRVDGGMAANAWLCQFLADILGVPVERPGNLETTALGAAYLAGLTTGVWTDLPSIARSWSMADRFEPRLDRNRREILLAGWRDAVARTLRA
jgi:glycerol kinase